MPDDIRPGLLARLGRFCHRFRWLVVAFWVLVTVGAAVFSGQLFDRLGASTGSAAVHESTAGYDLLAAASENGEQFVVLVDGVPIDDPVLLREAGSAVADVSRIAGVAQVVPGFAKQAPEALRATDGRAALVVVDLAKALAWELQEKAVTDVRDRFRTLERRVPGADVSFGGQLIVDEELGTQAAEDLQRGEAVSLPVTLVILVFIFRGLYAAAIPLTGTVVTIAGSVLVLIGMSYRVTLDANVVTVTTVLGFALSIDYSLLMVSRCRESLSAGAGLAEAVVETTATAGRTVVFSGLTVAASLCGLLCFESTFFRALGVAGVAVVLIALASTLTLTPAMLSWLPPGRGRHAWLAQGRHVRPRWGAGGGPDHGFFSALARHVQRRPVRYVLLVGAVLTLATLPFQHVQFGNGGPDLLPESFEGRQVAETVQSRFPGAAAEPITVVAPTDAAVLQRYADTQVGQRNVRSVGAAEQVGPSLSSVDVVPLGSSQGDQAQALVRDLRADEPGYPTWVTGDVASLVDFQDEIVERGPWALAVVVLSALVLLFLMTGSVLVPLKALVMNTLSLGASFGALVLVFQDGHLDELLGFTANGRIEVWVPVLVFVFAFGLSMDYEVFMLSRIREHYVAGADNDRSVAVGLQHSGRIITAAALLITIVFAGFAGGEMLGIKALGIAMSIAVVVDATLVRCLLVPATMTLLGDANWWAPGPLRRFHDRFGLREAPSTPPAPVRAYPRPARRAVPGPPDWPPRTPADLGIGVPASPQRTIYWDGRNTSHRREDSRR